MKSKYLIVIIGILSANLVYSQVGNDYCTGAYEIPVQEEGFGIPVQGNLRYSSPSFTLGNVCGVAYLNDLWYKFDATSSRTLFTKNAGDVYYNLYEDNCTTPIATKCLFTDIIDTEVGQTYYIRLISPSIEPPYFFSFTVEALPSDDPENFAPNNDCAGAISAEVGIGSCGTSITYETNLTTASGENTSCAGNSFSDIWYSVIAPPSGTIEFTSLQGFYNGLTIYENYCNDLVEVVCEKNISDKVNLYELTPGTTYLMRLLTSPVYYGTKEFCLTEGLAATNIDCSSAELITISTTCTDTLQASFVNTSTTLELECNNTFNLSERDFWYEFEAPSSGNIFLENTGSINTFSLFDGSCNALNPISCSIDLFTTSYISNLTPGEIYKLRIWQRTNNNEDFSICITTIDNPLNDDCAGATPISVQSNTCTEVQEILPAGTTHTGDPALCSDDNTVDAWYTFEATSESIEFSVNATYLAKTLYTGSCGSLTPIACVKGSIISGLTVSENYYLQISGPNTLSSDFCILTNNAPNLPHNICTGAIELTDNTNFSIDLDNARINPTDLTTCAFKPHDYWYEFTATTDNVKITNNDFSGKTFVLYEGIDCNNLQEIRCDKFITTDTDFTYGNLNDGETYYLQVYDEEHNNFNSHSFNFDFVTPPSNDLCDQAEIITANSCINIAFDFSQATLSDIPLPSNFSGSSTVPFKDLWYKITVNSNGGFQFRNRSFGSNEVNLLYSALYNLDCNNLTEIDIALTTQNNNYTYFGLDPNGVYLLRLLNNESDNGDFCTTYVYIPSNNDCYNAQSINVGIDNCTNQTTANLTSASTSDLSSSCITGNDLFYSFEMPKTSDIAISHFGSSTFYTLYSQSCGNLNEISCLSIGNYGIQTIPNLIEGESYILQLSGSGDKQFCLYTIPEITVESMCESAVPIVESTDNNCNNVLSGSTVNAATSNGAFCGAGEAEAVFYSFTPSSTTYYTFDITNNAADHKIALYEDCTLQSTLACGQNKITTSIEAGMPYIIAVYPTIQNVSSSFDFCVHSTPETFTDNIGISTENPQAKLDINGGIKPGYTDNQIAGNIRWNGDLEVYDGLVWQSLVGWDHSATEDITMNGKRITGLNTPLANNHAATKSYVDDHTDADADSSNEIQSLTKSGNTITLSDGGSVEDENTTYSGADFAMSNQVCPNGQVIIGIKADGTVNCALDSSDDADNDPTNEIETWNTLAGIPAPFADGTDDIDDADNDPTNEIETWATLAGIPAAFADGTDDVNDADNDPTNEIETWATLAGIPAAFADGTDDVNDADNDPTNEIETWATLAGIPAAFADDTDDVNDADNDPNNEKITGIELDGTEIIITEDGTEHNVDLNFFSKVFERSGTTIKNTDSVNDDFLFGATELPTTGTTSESLILFDESKIAFRVGHLAGSDNWNTENLGFYSFGTGSNTLSSGYYTAAFNRDTKAESSYCTAFGRYNEGGGSSGAWISTDPIFEVGIGTLTATKNAFTILKSGRVGIGDSSPDGLLHLSNDGNGNVPQLTLTEQSINDGARINFNNTNTTTNKWTLYGKAENTTASSEFNLFHTSTGNIITARGNGDVGIGGVPDMDFHIHHGNSASTSGMKIENSSNGSWIRMYVSSGTGDLRFYSSSQGTSIIGTINDVTGAYTALSDRRVKKDFESLRFDWAKFMQLKPLTYKFIKDKDQKSSIGMVAQDVNEIYPELITYHEEDDIYHMDYSGVGVVALKAVQELKKENEQLKEQLNDVLQRLEKLENK